MTESQNLTLNERGEWVPATPLGWQEEHGWFARLVFRVRGVKHCCDDEAKS